jgi:hypothetical protein
VRVTVGDCRCLMAGHTARLAINALRRTWDVMAPIANRFLAARKTVDGLLASVDPAFISTLVRKRPRAKPKGDQGIAAISI